MATKKQNKKNKVRDFFYLSAPLAFIVFILRDVVGGFNSPGYSWISQPICDLFALNSFSLVYSIVFTVIASFLIIVAVFLIWKYFKGQKINKIFKRGFVIYIIATIVIAISSLAFYPPEQGLVSKIKEYSQDVTRTETVQKETDNSTNSQASPETEEKTVLDEEATNQNHEKLAEILSNPSVIGLLVGLAIGSILFLVSLAFMFYGGFSKGGSIMFGLVALACLTFAVYGFISTLFMDQSSIGINSRFVYYAPYLFAVFTGSYIYVNSEPKNN